MPAYPDAQKAWIHPFIHMKPCIALEQKAGESTMLDSVERLPRTATNELGNSADASTSCHEIPIHLGSCGLIDFRKRRVPFRH